MLVSEGHAPGCIGRIVQSHATYCAASNGFGVESEALVASEPSRFLVAYTPGRDGLWLARRDVSGETEGSVALDGSGDAGAHLRWFITSDALRGQRVGRQLLQRALAFADRSGHDKVFLWTFAGLAGARHLYESCGFVLVHESPGARWGTVVTEQRFERGR